MSLYQHHKHSHEPVNANVIQELELMAAGFNQRIAVAMTKLFSAMPTFWLILAWIALWIAANATIASFDPMPWPMLLTLASVPQLPLMIVIMVGQGLLGRKQEIQADEQFRTTQRSYHDIEQIVMHLEEQDRELLKQTAMLLDLLKRNESKASKRPSKAVSVELDGKRIGEQS